MTDHPHFERPPVIETVLGVTFQSLAHFNNAHLGAFWKFLGTDWPFAEQAQPVMPRAELGLLPKFLDFASSVNCRIQIRNKPKNRMAQLQNGGFFYNWLGAAGGDYPRFTKLKPEFDAQLQKLQDFMKSESLGPIQINGWELTYVNHIEKGGLWHEADLSRLLTGIHDVSTAGSAKMSSFHYRMLFQLPDNLGQVNVEVKPAKRKSDDKSILIFTLTGRGQIEDDRSLDAKLETGHEKIVQLFVALTTDLAHKEWRMS